MRTFVAKQQQLMRLVKGGNLPITEALKVIQSAIDKSEVTPNLNDLEKPIKKNRWELWLHPKQQDEDGPRPSGREVYKALLPDQTTYKPKPKDLIHKCARLQTLEFYENNPGLIPYHWNGKVVYAWGSARHGGDVPYLCCLFAKPFIDWFDIDSDFEKHEPALLRAS